jgi:hypothetical protein
MAFPHKDPDKEPLLVIVHPDTLPGPCFTVKFHVERCFGMWGKPWCW